MQYLYKEIIIGLLIIIIPLIFLKIFDMLTAWAEKDLPDDEKSQGIF